MIFIKDLIYDYSDKRALHKVSFEIDEGSITALVGPNGSGKTTLLRSMAALAKPLSGEIRINGFDAFTQPREVHLQVGYLQDLFGLYDQLTVIQSLRFTAHSRMKPGMNVNAAVELAATRAGINGFLDKKVSSLSRGMRQRVGIAQAIIHQPPVLLLDEPASGLDPEARYSLSHLLLALRDAGMTIIVSSHILAELEDYSTGMLVIQEGRMIEHRLLKAVTEKDNYLHIFLRLTQYSNAFIEFIKTMESVKEVIVTDKGISLKLNEKLLSSQQLLKILVLNDLPIVEFGQVKMNLQDEYIKTVSNYRQSKA
ncbi:MAG: ABC transporter ATP-binding protein [Bacteroidia bacterium]|nr:ABC transporter ATP-binding protein [Bacteroidia bacterium]